MSDPFKIDTNDVLGINYSAYKTKVYALALSEPSKYYGIREKVVGAMKTAAVKNIYEIIYNFLKDGETGTTGVNLQAMIGAKPGYPSSKINEIALGAAESLDAIIEETLKICLPCDYNNLAQQKLTQKGAAIGIDK
jgi:hypothetical protein